MADEFPRTTQLHGWLERMRAGDEAARNELYSHIRGRLERLTHKMLAGYPRVGRWAEADDVLQNALLRLDRALREVQPGSVKAFLGLAAQQIRRELLDLARHFHGPQGKMALHSSRGHVSGAGIPDKEDDTYEPSTLRQWSEVHEQIERLPEEERDVVGLLFYQGLTQTEAALVLGIALKTVQRRWRSALLKLNEILGGKWPGD
jgi:RNA polymerase sigma-70 factor (ECF subfamily)